MNDNKLGRNNTASSYDIASSVTKDVATSTTDLLREVKDDDEKDIGHEKSADSEKGVDEIKPAPEIEVNEIIKEGNQEKKVDPTPELHTFSIKLGWIQGVLIPCLLNIWGVMLFLRITWVVAQAGIWMTALIIIVASIVCIITTLSLSAICTNGVVRGGGVYYLVSRSLGVELGASVGIIFAFANAVAASMNTIGFCLSLNELLKSQGVKLIDNSVNDIRIVGTVALLILCAICAIGMTWETKAQNILLAVILVAITSYIIGACRGPQNATEIAQGFVGLNPVTAAENWHPDFRYSEGQDHDFFSVFAIYFPAVTGVQAGANICGDLKDPAKAIPKGTFIALGIAMTSYFMMALMCSFGAMRDASGNTTVPLTELANCKPMCPYGLHNNYEIMHLMSLWGPLIYVGCWAATLSTALTNLLSVPRLIQALGKDRVYPGLIFFSKPYGRHGEPYRGYVLVFIISLTFLIIADLNTIAPLITNFYLASYALINFCTFHAEYTCHISWRPTFQGHNRWLSLIGFLMCLSIMIIISWIMALVTVLVFLTLYMMVVYSKPVANWGSSTEAQRYRETVTLLVQLSQRPTPIKSYNPQLLVMAGTPYKRPAILDMAHLITKLGSFMVVADICKETLTTADRQSRFQMGREWLKMGNYRAFYVVMDGYDFEDGARALMQNTGLGRLTPNILHIGFKTNWIDEGLDELSSYVQVIQYAFERQLAVLIQRMPQVRREQDFGGDDVDYQQEMNVRIRSQMLAVLNADSELSITSANADIEKGMLEERRGTKVMKYSVSDAADGSVYSQTLLGIRRKSARKSTTIYAPMSFTNNSNLEAWWLFDDGGLGILLTYIISQRDFKNKLMLRIFALGRATQSSEQSYNNMKALLHNFRIEYSQLNILHGLSDSPNAESWAMFYNIVNKFRTKGRSDVLITEHDLSKQYIKTSRHLRLREMLQEHSVNSSLVVISLPRPRKGKVPLALYLTWLELLSKDLPPVLFVRGNDMPVLCS